MGPGTTPTVLAGPKYKRHSERPASDGQEATPGQVQPDQWIPESALCPMGSSEFRRSGWGVRVPRKPDEDGNVASAYIHHSSLCFNAPAVASKYGFSCWMSTLEVRLLRHPVSF